MQVSLAPLNIRSGDVRLWSAYHLRVDALGNGRSFGFNLCGADCACDIDDSLSGVVLGVY